MVEDVFWVVGLALDDGHDDNVGYKIVVVVVVEW